MPLLKPSATPTHLQIAQVTIDALEIETMLVPEQGQKLPLPEGRNEVLLEFVNAVPNDSIHLLIAIFKAFDDGIGFHYYFLRSSNLQDCKSWMSRPSLI